MSKLFLSLLAALAPVARAAVTFDVLATGGAYVDVVGRIDRNLILRAGVPVNGGGRVSLEQIKALRAKMVEPVPSAGGMSANTAADVASLGGRAGFIGKVAKDRAGEVFRQDFARRGVRWCNSPEATRCGPTGAALILLSGDDRAVAYHEGCADALTDEDFAAVKFDDAAFFLVEGKQLLSPRLGPVVRRAISRARGHTRVVVTLQSFETLPDVDQVAGFIRANADLIAGNAEEQSGLDRVAPRNPDQAVLTTRGAEGVSLELPDGSQLHAPAVRPLKFESPVGAGDALLAGYLLGLARERTPFQSLLDGVAAATEVLGEYGARLDPAR